MKYFVFAILALAAACSSPAAPNQSPCASDMAQWRQDHGPPDEVRNISATVQVWQYAPLNPAGYSVVFDWTSGVCVEKTNPG